MSNPKMRTAAEWQADLDQSERELAAGLTVSSGIVKQGLRESIARLEAKRDAKLKRSAA